MNLRERPASQRGAAAALADTRGAVAVEFAFISTIVLLLLIGGFYLSFAITTKRDVARAAAELSNSLSQCSTSACVLANGTAVMNAQANIFPNTPGLVLGWAMVSRSSGSILVDFGNMTSLPSDVNTAALNVLKNDNDNGVCVLISHDIGFNLAPASWGNFDQSRGYVCNLQSRNVKMVGA